MRYAFIKCKYKYQAVKKCPWASAFMKVTEGYLCFESWQDYSIKKDQK